MGSPQRSTGLAESLWRRGSHPATSAALLAAAAVTLAARAEWQAETLAAASRFLVLAAAASLACLLARIAAGPNEWGRELRAWLNASGLRVAASLPWFDEELDAGSLARIAGTPQSRPWSALAFLVFLVLIVPLSVAAASSFALLPESYIELLPGEEVDFERGADGIARQLPFRLSLAPSGVARDGATRLAVRNRDRDEATEVPLVPGRVVRAGDRLLRLDEVVPTTRIAGVLLRVQPRDGGEARELRLPVGGAPVPVDGETTLAAVDATLGHLGLPLPAVRIVETHSGAVTRDGFVLWDRGEFDARHGDGVYQVAFTSWTGASGVRLQSTPAWAGFVPPVVAVWGMAVMLLLWLLRRAAPFARGRSGDRVVELPVLGSQEVARAAVRAACLSALPASSHSEWDALNDADLDGEAP